MKNYRKPTATQTRHAQRCAALILDDTLCISVDDVHSLFAYCSDDIFGLWLKIENEQYIRIGGTDEDSEKNDALHHEAGVFASTLISDIWSKIYDHDNRGLHLVIPKTVRMEQEPNDEHTLFYLPIPNKFTKGFYVVRGDFSKLLKANCGNQRAIQYLTDMAEGYV